MKRRTLVNAILAASATACGGKTETNAHTSFNHASEGASLTNPARGALSWMNHMDWGEGAIVSSLATNGATVSAMLARAEAFDALFDDSRAAGRNVAWFWCEAPEMHVDGSGDLVALRQHIATWIADRNARGWLTVIKTVIPCGVDPGFEAARSEINDWIRAGASAAAVIDDWAAVWPGDAASYPSLFTSDMIHTSALGADFGVNESSAPVCRRLAP